MSVIGFVFSGYQWQQTKVSKAELDINFNKLKVSYGVIELTSEGQIRTGKIVLYCCY